MATASLVLRVHVLLGRGGDSCVLAATNWIVVDAVLQNRRILAQARLFNDDDCDALDDIGATSIAGLRAVNIWKLGEAPKYCLTMSCAVAVIYLEGQVCHTVGIVGRWTAGHVDGFLRGGLNAVRCIASKNVQDD